MVLLIIMKIGMKILTVSITCTEWDTQFHWTWSTHKMQRLCIMHQQLTTLPQHTMLLQHTTLLQHTMLPQLIMLLQLIKIQPLFIIHLTTSQSMSMEFTLTSTTTTTMT